MVERRTNYPTIERRLGEIEKIAKDNRRDIQEIKKKIDPIVEEKKFRDTLDEKVEKWGRRIPWLVPLIASIIFYFYWKAIIPMANHFLGEN